MIYCPLSVSTPPPPCCYSNLNFLGTFTLPLLIHFPSEDSDFKPAFISELPSRRLPVSLVGGSVSAVLLPCFCRLISGCFLLPVILNMLPFPRKRFLSPVLSLPSFCPPNVCFPRELWPRPFPSSALPVLGPSPCVASCGFLRQPASKGRGLVLSPVFKAAPGARWTPCKH